MDENEGKSPPKVKIDWQDTLWVLTMGAQGGLLVAVPVLVGLGLGILLDNQFGTLPCIALALTLVGGVLGPVMLYRWVRSSVALHVQKRLDEKKGEEKPE
ncbi:MAG: AtpZ/AtpI family protein [Anaerolineae bacterium]|nr:AtpZ/AtpI family protein [Anaerolineae bacterium]